MELIIRIITIKKFPFFRISISKTITPENKLEKIIQQIIKIKGVDLRTNLSQKREIVDLRFIFCKIAEENKCSRKDTGLMINRDVVTILNSLNKFSNYYETDKEFKALYNKIKNYEG